MAAMNGEGRSALERGRALCEQRMFAAAAEAFVEAATADPSDPQARLWLGYVYEQLGRHQLALEQYQAGLQVAPGNMDLRRAAARMHAALQTFQQTAEAFPRSARSAPERRMLGVVIAAVVCFVGVALLAVYVVVALPRLARPASPAVAVPEESAPVPPGELRFEFEGQPTEEAAPPAAAAPDAKLRETLNELRAAVRQFHDRYGCYPARLEDLVASSAPASGVDDKGSSVPLSGDYPGPTLSTSDGLLPVDPVMGGRTSWVYRTSPPDVGSVHSGAFGVSSEGKPYSEF